MGVTAKAAHIWDREEYEHYVEPQWCSRRLFDVEPFIQEIWDPACGFGRIIQSAKAAHLPAYGTDIVHRGYELKDPPSSFFSYRTLVPNIVCNPPFDIFEKFVNHALQLSTGKVAMIWLVARLNAARWLQKTPLRRIWLLTPRPSMPPGYVISAGQKPGGGSQDFCWLVWEQGFQGRPELGWLHRDAA